MTDPSERDVRALLAGLEVGPLPELDVDAVMRGGRRYQRRQAAYRGLVSLVVVLAAGAVVLGVAQLSGRPAPQPVSPPPSSSPTPTPSPSPSGTTGPIPDAVFTPTGSMSTARWAATATLLADGRVLVAGGMDGNSHGRALASAELYDPATGRFTATGSMGSPRVGATATLLTDGRVLIAGGVNGTAVNNAVGGWLSSAELYNPATGTFTATGAMGGPREGATTTRLPDGRVLICGGDGPGGKTLSSAELYNPAGSTFTATGSMSTPREYVNATPLPNGQVLIAGGGGVAGGYDPLSSAELYDPATGTFTPTGSMPAPRFDATATLLADGRVLIAGGNNGAGPSNGGHTVSSAELYDPATGGFTPTASMTSARYDAMAVLLPDGRVLIAGGAVDGGGYLSSAELYRPGPAAPPGRPRPAAGTTADLPITAQLRQQLRDSYYQAYLADPNPQALFGPPGQPESAVLLTNIDHAGVVYGQTAAHDDYWVVAGICLGNPVGCQDGGSVQVFRRTGPTGLYSYTLDPQHVIDICSIPAPLLKQWYPSGLLPAGIRCPQPPPVSSTPAR